MKSVNPYLNFNGNTEEETKRLFNGLSADGSIQMSLANTGWAKQFGMLTDKFGTQWMIYHPS